MSHGGRTHSTRRPGSWRRGVAAAARRGAALAVGIAWLAAPAAAQESFGDRLSGFGTRVGDAMAIPFDILVLRPLAVASTAAGAAFFVPAAVLSAPGGLESLSYGFETFVATSAKDVYERPLGEF